MQRWPRAAPACGPARRRLLQVVLELPRPRRVAQLAQRLGLDLADPLARDVELLADLLQRPGATVLQPEPQLKDPPLAARQRVQDRLHLLLEQLVRRGLRGRQSAAIL